jgi:hypothetical protein
MTKQNLRLQSLWLLFVALVWSAAFAFCANRAQADESPMYRMHTYKKNGSRLTVFLRGPTDLRRAKRRLKLNLPISLEDGQTIVDGVAMGKDCILAALSNNEEVTVYQVSLLRDAVGGSNKANKALRVEHRPPTTGDAALFEGLPEVTGEDAVGGKGDGGVSSMGARRRGSGPGSRVGGIFRGGGRRCGGRGNPCPPPPPSGCQGNCPRPNPGTVNPGNPGVPPNPGGSQAGQPCTTSDGKPGKLKWVVVGTQGCNTGRCTPVYGWKCVADSTSPPTTGSPTVPGSPKPPPSGFSCPPANRADLTKLCSSSRGNTCCLPSEGCGADGATCTPQGGGGGSSCPGGNCTQPSPGTGGVIYPPPGGRQCGPNGCSGN